MVISFARIRTHVRINTLGCPCSGVLYGEICRSLYDASISQVDFSNENENYGGLLTVIYPTVLV
jgi:hypothetical protein